MKRFAWYVLACGLVSAGCSTDGGCPEGQEAIRGVCVGGADAGADGAAGDGGGDASVEIVRCEPTGDYSAFGTSCTTQDDCACPAGTCNTEMGNICTELNCMRTDADGGMVQVCPPDWTCLSLDGFPSPPGVNSICIPPS